MFSPSAVPLPGIPLKGLIHPLLVGNSFIAYKCGAGGRMTEDRTKVILKIDGKMVRVIIFLLLSLR
jgi:hypothetical protein